MTVKIREATPSDVDGILVFEQVQALAFYAARGYALRRRVLCHMVDPT